MRDAVSLIFRAATGADVDDVVALVESAYRGDVSRSGWTTEADLLDGQRTDTESIRTVVADPRSVLLLADRPDTGADSAARRAGEVVAGSPAGSQLVACCHLRNDGGSAYFGMFAVRPGIQGAGIGRAVVTEAESRAGAWGCAAVWMTVIGQRSELIAWYERLGYERTGETRPFPYGDERFGLPRRDDLSFITLRKALTGK